MKKNFLFAIGVVMMLGACTSSTTTTGDKDAKIQSADSTQIFNLDTTTFAAGTAYYQCPMDLSEISDKPGICPKCGMDLEKMVKQ